MNIRVVRQDATEVGADALVVPANRQLTLGWGSHLAEKVLKLAGPEVEREALEAHPDGIAMGEAVLTGPGRMRGFKWLIHAAVLDKYDFNPLFLLRLKERTSRETLASAVTSSLHRAAEAGARSLVLTPMGAGIGGMKDSVCADVMLTALRSSPHDLDVLIACLSPRPAQAFESLL